MQNIVTVEFRTENEAYSALEELKKEQKTYGYKILQMGLVKKENGVDTPIAGFDFKEGKGNAGAGGVGGGLVGGLIGILGGPIGVAIGLGAGAGIGVGTGKVATKNLKLKNMMLMKQALTKMPENAVALIALVDEEEEIVFDNRLKKYKYRIKINHYNVEELENEMAEAERLEEETKLAEEKKIQDDMSKMESMAKEKVRAEKDRKKAEKKANQDKEEAEIVEENKTEVDDDNTDNG